MVRSDEDLFSAFVLREELEPLAELYRRRAPGLLATARNRVRDADVAEDLVQATFVVAIEGREAFDRSRPLGPWLHGILLNQCRRWRSLPERSRAATVDPDTLETSADPGPLDGAGRRELVGRIRGVLSELPSHYAEVVEPVLLRGQSVAQVAAALATSESTIRTRLYRGLQKVRQRLPVEFAPIVVLAFAAQAGFPAPLAPALRVPSGARRAVAALAVSLPILLGAALWCWQSSGPPAAIAALGPRSGAVVATTGLASPPVRIESDTTSALPQSELATVTVRVRLRDPSTGEPIRGTSIRLMRAGGGGQNLIQSIAKSGFSATTDAVGIAEFAAVPRWRSALIFDDLYRRSEPFDVRPGMPLRDEAPVPAYWITGSVRSKAGPLADAAVWLSSSAGIGSCGYVAGRSDEAGGFRVPAYRANCWVWAEAAELARSNWVQSSGESGAVSLTLGERSCVLSGIVSSPGGAVGSATVAVYPLGESSEPIVLSATDSAGRYRVAGLHGGRYSVVAAHASWAPGRGECLVDVGENDLSIRMDSGGEVVAQINGPPGEYSLMCIPLVAEAESRELGLRVRVARGEVPGDLRAAQMEAGPFRCIVTGADHRTLHEWHYPPLRVGETRVLAIDLAGKGELRGRVVGGASEVPLRILGVSPGVRLDTEDSVAWARVGENGEFVLLGAVGALDLHVQPLTSTGEPMSLPVRVASGVLSGAGPATVHYDQRFRATAWLTGHVAGKVGELRVAHDHYVQPLRGLVDAATGRFRIGPLPAGSYGLLSTNPSAELLRVTLDPGQVSDVGDLHVPSPRRVEWRFLGDRATVQGVHTIRVLSPTGRLLAEYPNREPVALRPGRYLLECWGSRSVPVRRPFEVLPEGGRPVWVDLQSAPAVEFRFPFSKLIAGISDIELHVSRLGATDEFRWRLARAKGPEFRMHTGLAPGRYRMRVAGHFDREFDVDTSDEVLQVTETIRF